MTRTKVAEARASSTDVEASLTTLEDCGVSASQKEGEERGIAKKEIRLGV